MDIISINLLHESIWKYRESILGPPHNRICPWNHHPKPIIMLLKSPTCQHLTTAMTDRTNIRNWICHAGSYWCKRDKNRHLPRLIVGLLWAVTIFSGFESRSKFGRGSIFRGRTGSCASYSRWRSCFNHCWRTTISCQLKFISPKMDKLS